MSLIKVSLEALPALEHFMANFNSDSFKTGVPSTCDPIEAAWGKVQDFIRSCENQDAT